MPNKPTLKAYIKTLDDKKLSSLFEYIIAEMNRRKAKEQNVDVGFWNSDGVYIEDIQKIDEFDEWNELNEEISNSDETIKEIMRYAKEYLPQVNVWEIQRIIENK